MEKNGRIEKDKTPAEDEAGKVARHIVKGTPLYHKTDKKRNSFEKIASMLHTSDSDESEKREDKS